MFSPTGRQVHRMLPVVTEDEDGMGNHHTKYQNRGNEKRPWEGYGRGMFLVNLRINHLGLSLCAQPYYSTSIPLSMWPLCLCVLI